MLILTFTVISVVQMPYTLELAREQAEGQLASLPPEQAEAAREAMAFTLSLPFLLTTTLGVGVLALLFGLLIQATILYFGALITGGDDMRFGSVFTMSAWARLPLALGYLVQAGFVFFTQGAIRYPGLAFMVATDNPLEDAKNPMLPLLASIDIFWLWSLLLAIIGLAVVARISRGKALVLVLIYAAVSLGITVLPSIIFGAGLGQ